MCVLFASISWLISDAVVVFAGERSLAYYYNIRHAILHEKVTLYNTKMLTVYNTWQGQIFMVIYN